MSRLDNPGAVKTVREWLTHTIAFIDRCDGDVRRERNRAVQAEAQVDALREQLRIAASALRTGRDELSRWGWGDFHYGENMPQDSGVRAAVAEMDAALFRLREKPL